MELKEAFQETERILKKSPNRGSFYLLRNEVIDAGRCIECGTCVSVCEYDALSWNTVLNKPELGGGESKGHCVACGVCYHQCPQTIASEHVSIGKIDDYFIVKSSKFKGQDGGTVTTLLVELFSRKLIEAAIVTEKTENWEAQARIVTSSEEVEKITGSIYSHSQVAQKIIEAVRNGFRKIAVVGVPCKINAIKTMLSEKEGILGKIDDLKIYLIGLFCMESFEPSKLRTILEGKDLDIEKITKMDFSGGKFRIYYGEKEEAALAISSLHDAIEPSCLTCGEFSSEYADISIGSVGAPQGYNFVITRIPFFTDLMKELIEKGVFIAEEVKGKNVRTVMKTSQKKKEAVRIKVEQTPKYFNPEEFSHHEPREWNINRFNYEPEVHVEYYKRLTYNEYKLNESSSQDSKGEVFIAKVPPGNKEQITTYQYTTNYELTKKLFEEKNDIKGAKVLIKPNNTGFVGIFKNEILSEILKKNGITDDADHQPIATQPAMLAGIVDALLDLGVKEIHIGENMLWDGGTPRAFYETGYTRIFTDRKYRGKVYFIDLYENDPPSEMLEKLSLPLTKYCKGDYYNTCYPPKPLFNEKYTYVIIASVVKAHNCAYYTLSNKNFSVSWNPRKKTGKIEPRWHIHAVPLDIFNPKRIKEILGEDFKRKNKIYVREVYRHKWDFSDKYRVVRPKKGQIILSNKYMSSSLLNHFKSYGHEVLDVDPHHWSGINIGLLTLGMGYLINRYTRIFAAVLKRLEEQGTKVAGICSGIVGQEGDGPLIYGATKYAGFNVASFDHTALERVTTELMFSEDETGFIGFLKRRQEKRMKLHGINAPELIKEVENLWTLKIMKDLIGGELELNKIPITLLEYGDDKKFANIKVEELYKLREGKAFRSSLGYYCNPDLWLELMHNNDSLYLQMMLIERGSIEIPLIPGVVG